MTANQSDFTEDDTYEALKRIPWQELERQHGTALFFIKYRIVNIRAVKKLNDREARRAKLMKFLSYLCISMDDNIQLNCNTNPMYSMENEFAGTGWSNEAIIKKITNDLDKEADDKKSAEFLYWKKWALVYLSSMNVSAWLPVIFGPIISPLWLLVFIAIGVIAASIGSILIKMEMEIG